MTKFATRATPILLVAALLLSGCGRSRSRREVAYVSAPQAFLRDRVAAVYNRVATVKNAEQVEVLDRDRRFVLVRTAAGAEGWMEQRFLVDQKVFDGFQKLAKEQQSDPVQATGFTRSDTNIHLDPARDAEHLYQLNQGSKIAILKRATSEKVLPGSNAKPIAKDPDAPKPMEDWWLVRDPDGHVGWVLARMVDGDVPLEIAQYAEGQRIVASFVLNQVADAEKQVPQYLVLFTEPRDGMPFDFNQARVFTWNVKKHRYETAYREHKLNGYLPVTVSQETFDKEGTLPVFVLRVQDDAGNTREQKYKLNTPIVRKVAPQAAASPQASGKP